MNHVAKYFSKKTVGLCILACLSVVIFAFQNCGQRVVGDDTPNSPSPFAGSPNGILLSPGRAAQKILPANTVLNFVVDDVCFQDRKAKNSTRYFLDRYFSQFIPAAAGARLAQSLIQVSLPVPLDSENLVRIKKTDRCIVGISDDQGNQFAVSQAAYSDPQASGQDYLQRTGYFEVYPTFNDDLAPASVTVAVIDTGFDMNNTDGVTFGDLMIGSNRLDGGSTPQDDNGHGTMLGSLIAAKGNNGTGMIGVAGYSAKLLPIRVLGGQDPKGNLKSVFEAVKHAINAGADVINLSLGAPATNPNDAIPVVCDPAIGHLIYKAIENRAFLVMSAGNHMYCEMVNGVQVCRPGVTYSPKDNSWSDLRKDSYIPACWARYFKGALSVTAVDSTGHVPRTFGNWGADAVEIAAPGQGVLAQNLNNQYVRQDGTSFSTALVTAAVANTIAFYKKQGWYYNPWMIEDTVLNGSPVDPNLQDDRGVLVRLQKTLNYRSLAAYLTSMKSWTEQQRRSQFSDNPEAGLTRTIAGVPTRVNIVKLDVYTKEPLLYVKDQAQIQAVLYYDNADMEVVSDRAQWSVDRTDAASITSTGLFLPTQTGNFVVTATYNGVTARANLTVSSASVVTGTAGQLQAIEQIPTPGEVGGVFTINFVSCDLDANMQIRARYSDGTIRYVDGRYGTHFLFAKYNGNLVARGQWDSLGTGQPFYFPGREMVTVTLYRGMRADLPFTLKASPNPGPRFWFNGALSVDDQARITRLWIEAPTETGKYDVFATIPGFGKGWPEMQVAPNCYATNIVRSNSLPPLPANRVLNQSYPTTLSYDYWGTGVREQTSVTYQQIPVENQPIAMKFGSRDISSQRVTRSDATFTPSGFRFRYASGYLEFADGSVQNFVDDDVTMRAVPDGDPNVDNCNKYVYGGPAGSFPSWDADSYYKAGVTTQIEIRHKRYPNLVTYGQMVSTEPDWTNGRTASRTIAAISTTPPPVPATDSRCNSNLPFAAGAGTPANPWLICTLAQLKAMKGRGLESYQLGDNIDMTGFAVLDAPLPFLNFDGRGYWIKNLTLTDAEKPIVVFNIGTSFGGNFKSVNFDNVNLRGYADPFKSTGIVGGNTNISAPTVAADISDVFISNSKLIGGGGIVATVAKSMTRVRGVNVEAYADCNNCGIGGLVGQAGSVSNSLFQGIIGFTSPGNVQYIGGMAASVVDLSDNVVEASIRSGPNSASIGGIAGVSSGMNVYRNKFTGSVLGTNSGSVGGILGASYGQLRTIAGNFADAQLEGAGSVGGIVGNARAPLGLFNNVARGRITARSNAGGIIGTLDYARLEGNVVGTTVTCDLPETCGAVIGSVKHLPLCPTLPDFNGNSIESGKSNGLAPIGSGPQGGRKAPPGISGEVNN